MRAGRPQRELVALARETGASAVLWASDATPYALARDRAVRAALADAGVEAVPGPGNFVADVGRPRTRGGTPFTVFTPFHRAWQQLERRPVHRAPAELPPLPSQVAKGRLPALEELVGAHAAADAGALAPGAGLPGAAPGGGPLAQPVVEPGEAAARRAAERWFDGGLADYARDHDRLAGGASQLSAYLRFGLLSPRELEQRAERRGGDGGAAFARQLAWRDFYAHVLLHHPANLRREHQERMRRLRWEHDDEGLVAWQEGRTGFPLVDAGMRQLRACGWMHNRARLVVGSFLTKDLQLDWRAGEAWFMRWLLDGDVASNNGNWQWIASVGVDPAPAFRRILSPVLQQQRHDPDGAYVRRWVPELSGVPDELLAEPWRMTAEQQRAAGCVIGRDYPAPLVDHREERQRALARYRETAAG